MKYSVKSLSATLFITAALFVFVGCQEKGPGEKAGEKLDTAVENIKDGENPLKETGVGEKAGEAVDKAVSSMSSAVDSHK